METPAPGIYTVYDLHTSQLMHTNKELYFTLQEGHTDILASWQQRHYDKYCVVYILLPTQQKEIREKEREMRGAERQRDTHSE